MVCVVLFAAACADAAPSSDDEAADPAVSHMTTATSEPMTPAPPTAPVATTTDAPTTTDTAATTSTLPPTTTTAPPAPPPPIGGLEGVSLGFDLIADVRQPTAAAWSARDPAMYVSTQPGPIYRVSDGEPSVVIDLTDQTFPDEPGSERGVLGIAFDPRNGRMFVNYTDRSDDTQVVSFELVDGVAVADSRRQVLSIEQPGVGHNGGRLTFDADGNLYIASGDGGGSNGRDAQDTTKLLGALLRVTPRLDGDGYDIPPDNPNADGLNDRAEVLARGFRNPWSFSIDDDTGDIWIGDVGNSTEEEISVLTRDRWGANFGWPFLEGTAQRRSGAPEELVPPVHTYGRSDGVAVMGGHVYRGERIPALRGAYLFADLGGPVWALGADGFARLEAERVNTITGWSEGPDSELYLLGFGGVFAVVER